MLFVKVIVIKYLFLLHLIYLNLDYESNLLIHHFHS
nr:MAG TPA: hypothetical protein [Crassvirales sp.]